MRRLALSSRGTVRFGLFILREDRSSAGLRELAMSTVRFPFTISCTGWCRIRTMPRTRNKKTQLKALRS